MEVEHSPGDIARPRDFRRGEELARFEMGSTIVLLLPPGAGVPLDTLRIGDPVRLGEPIGSVPGAEPRE